MKRFIRNQRGMTAMECAKEYIEKEIIPMITFKETQESKIYKEVDKFLLEQGYKKVFVDEVINDRIIIPSHYEYIK